MINVLFVCLGNICRSPMAEVVFKDMLEKEVLADKVSVDSAATSSYEVGNPAHQGTKERLAEEGLSADGLTSRQLNDRDLEADYIVAMDSSNIENIEDFIDGRNSGEVRKLLSYAGRDDDIADPWYTGNFDVTYDDVVEGCTALLEEIKETHFN